MNNLILILVLLVGLPQLSETVYTPSLPIISHSLNTSPSLTEQTLTIFIFGLALGTLLWGRLSDKFGRKPCALIGIAIFIIGCIGCYYSTNIHMLMVSRFISSLGCSVGSVLGQTIARDSFDGPSLGKVYSIIGMSLGLFPAIGPVIGGWIAEYYGWNNIFLFLSTFGIILFLMLTFHLKETLNKTQHQHVSMMFVAKQLLTDRKVLSYTLIIGCINGISFSYFSEGSFYMIELLGMSPSNFGHSFIFLSAAIIFGGWISKRLQVSHGSKRIMDYGIVIVLISSFLFVVLAFSNIISVVPVIVLQMITRVGACMIMTNALALALVNYKNYAGTAQSLFGLFYYSLISLFTFFMGLLHNGTIFPMPLYFLFLSIIMFCITKKMKT